MLIASFNVNCVAKRMEFEIMLESSACTEEIQVRYFEDNVAKYGYLSNQNNILSNYSSIVDCQTFSKLLTLNDHITLVRKNGAISYEEDLPKSSNINFEYSSLNFKNVSEMDMFNISILAFTIFCLAVCCFFLVKLFIRTN